MKRKYCSESFIALAVVLFFDFFRLFYVLTSGNVNIFDFMWMLLLIVLVFFTYVSKDNKKHISIICIILGILPMLFVILNLIQIVSTGIKADFDFYFMLFESILIIGVTGLYFYQVMKYLKSEDKTSDNE